MTSDFRHCRVLPATSLAVEQSLLLDICLVMGVVTAMTGPVQAT